MDLDAPSYSEAFESGKIQGVSEYKESLKNVLGRLKRLYDDTDSPISANAAQAIIFIINEFDRKSNE